MTNVYIGFDFGMKRIGVAVGQDVTNTAKPIETLRAKLGVPDWSEISSLIKKWSPSALIVGIPYNMDGTEQAVTLSAREFAQALAEHSQLPVHEVDERLSTVAAREAVFEQGGYKGLKDAAIDSVAAQVILESWMRSNA